MAYALGIDVGTTFCAAAIAVDGVVEAVSLSGNAIAVPSVVFADGDELVYADAAVRRGAARTEGVAREFKRRLGDPVPLMLSGSPYHADRLTALMARWVRDVVTTEQGQPPTTITVTHPANWTPYQLDVLRKALVDVDMGGVGLLSEPAAAAIDYAASTLIEPDAVVLVYDLGGGTFDVALLRRTDEGFVHEIEPFGIERLGGIDFDEAVLQFVLAYVPDDVMANARNTPDSRNALAELRQRCVDAKEALSADPRADIPVVLPGHQTTVRITRGEFEQMIGPMIRQTIDGVRETLRRGRYEPGALRAALLVGGSSRIPLVPQMVSDELGLEVRVDAHPKLVVARGAARHAADAQPSAAAPPPPARRSVERPRPRRRGRLAAAAVVVLVVAAAGIAWALSRGGAGTAADPNPSSTSAGPTAFAAVDEIDTNALPLAVEVVGTELLVASVTTGTLQRFDLTAPGLPLTLDLDLGFNEAGKLRGQDIIPVGGDVYVTQHEGASVARVDQGGAVERIDIGGKPLDGVVHDGDLWVSVAPLTAAEPPWVQPIEGTTPGPPVVTEHVPGALEVIGGELWAVFFDAERIGRVDPTAGTVTDVDVPGGPSDLLAVGDELWVTLRQRDAVAVIDPAEMRVVDTIAVGPNPHKLIAAAGSVWVTNEGDARSNGTVSRIDPLSRQEVQPPIEVGLAPIDLAAGVDRVFVGNYNGRGLETRPGTVTVLGTG